LSSLPSNKTVDKRLNLSLFNIRSNLTVHGSFSLPDEQPKNKPATFLVFAEDCSPWGTARSVWQRWSKKGYIILHCSSKKEYIRILASQQAAEPILKTYSDDSISNDIAVRLGNIRDHWAPQNR
jgi:hypothetical protein